MSKLPPPNRFPGNCRICGYSVGTGKGYLAGKRDGRWTIECSPCVTGEDVPDRIPAIQGYDLTEEQQIALAAFQEGKSIAVQAGAGTGKTSLLLAIGQSTTRQGQYLAFNTAIVREAAEKFGAIAPNVRCSTINSIAWQGGGSVFKERLNAKRLSGNEIARRLDIKPITIHLVDADGDDTGEVKVLQPKALGSYALQAIAKFCQSDDLRPNGRKHLPYIDGIDAPGPRQGRKTDNNRLVQVSLQGAIERAWRDLSSPKGGLAVGKSLIHDVYVKLFALSDDCNIPADFILVDEAQDLAPVQLQILSKQRNHQIVIVGDSQQAIYGWRGAVDALDRFPSEETCYLTNSFRFGPEVASVANAILSEIESAQLRLVGCGAAGKVAPTSSPDAILTRSNAGAIRAVLQAQADGQQPFLVGGGGEVESFCKAAERLQLGERTDHPDLACFESWNEVTDYVANDPSGDDLKLLVNLIKDNGVKTILRAVANEVAEEDADVVVSTAHKSKGLQWDVVRVSGDFPAEVGSDEERRLLYVAVTRAKLQLDIEDCTPVVKILLGEA